MLLLIVGSLVSVVVGLGQISTHRLWNSLKVSSVMEPPGPLDIRACQSDRQIYRQEPKGICSTTSNPMGSGIGEGNQQRSRRSERSPSQFVTQLPATPTCGITRGPYGRTISSAEGFFPLMDLMGR